MTKSNKESDPVNHPKHYTKHPSGVECIQITEHMNFCIGNAVKYAWRADLKQNAVQDLEKAVWYLNREIARRKAMAGERVFVPKGTEITAENISSAKLTFQDGRQSRRIKDPRPPDPEKQAHVVFYDSLLEDIKSLMRNQSPKKIGDGAPERDEPIVPAQELKVLAKYVERAERRAWPIHPNREED